MITGGRSSEPTAPRLLQRSVRWRPDGQTRGTVGGERDGGKLQRDDNTTDIGEEIHVLRRHRKVASVAALKTDKSIL